MGFLEDALDRFVEGASFVSYFDAPAIPQRRDDSATLRATLGRYIHIRINQHEMLSPVVLAFTEGEGFATFQGWLERAADDLPAALPFTAVAGTVDCTLHLIAAFAVGEQERDVGTTGCADFEGERVDPPVVCWVDPS